MRELVAQSAELQANLCVAAHLTQVAYAGRRDANGQIVPRYQITLASAVDEETCRRVNLTGWTTENLAARIMRMIPTRSSSSAPGAIYISSNRRRQEMNKPRNDTKQHEAKTMN